MAVQLQVQLREIVCRECSQVFFVCQRCDYGRRYCGEPCRSEVRERIEHRARRDYALSKKGRLNNRERQRRFRRLHRTSGNKSQGKQNSVTDQSSQVGLPGVSCSHGETPAEPGPADQPATAPSAPAALVHRALCQPLAAQAELEATKKAAELAAKAASRASGCAVRVAQCHFCGAWGVVVEMTSTRGRFRRRPYGRHMNPRRRE